MKIFKNKTLLITGGTGSFGNALLSKLNINDFKEIRIFSRDEKKQDDMRKKFNNPVIKFFIGDVRNYDSVRKAIQNVDYVFHAAALKQVPSCEFFPIEAVNTNILGTENVLQSSIISGVKKVVCLSTDKAVYPINAMGISKAMMEKIAIANSINNKETIINITRYGNVMASRGSVIPLMCEQIINNKPITITDPNMTRFMMTLDDSVELVLYAFKNGKQGQRFIQKSPACNIRTLSKALLQIFDKSIHPINNIGFRHGEKMHEVLMSSEERQFSQETDNYFVINSDTRSLNYDSYNTLGNLNSAEINDYSSSNTNQLDLDAMINLLFKTQYIQSLFSK